MRRSSLGFIMLLCLVSAASCTEHAENIREISETRQCRANMNELCTEIATYKNITGEWAGSVDVLDNSSGRMWPLTCPESGLDYIITSDSTGYTIECPSGHGSISTGCRSWCE